MQTRFKKGAKVIDLLIASLYNLAIYLDPISEYTDYMLTEIWIRPTITYAS